MTIREAIERADEMRPNEIREELKFEWLARLDGKIAAEVMLQSPKDTRRGRRSYPEDMDTELLVEYPHDDLYVLHLLAQIDFMNEEFSSYANSATAFNAALDGFVRWFAQLYDPAQGYNRERW